MLLTLVGCCRVTMQIIAQSIPISFKLSAPCGFDSQDSTQHQISVETFWRKWPVYSLTRAISYERTGGDNGRAVHLLIRNTRLCS